MKTHVIVDYHSTNQWDEVSCHKRHLSEGGAIKAILKELHGVTLYWGDGRQEEIPWNCVKKVWTTDE